MTTVAVHWARGALDLRWRSLSRSSSSRSSFRRLETEVEVIASPFAISICVKPIERGTATLRRIACPLGLNSLQSGIVERYEMRPFSRVGVALEFPGLPTESLPLPFDNSEPEVGGCPAGEAPRRASGRLIAEAQAPAFGQQVGKQILFVVVAELEAGLVDHRTAECLHIAAIQ